MVTRSLKKVSNPWREAIEEDYKEVIDIFSKVSNPWREAIEVLYTYW